WIRMNTLGWILKLLLVCRLTVQAHLEEMLMCVWDLRCGMQCRAPMPKTDPAFTILAPKSSLSPIAMASGYRFRRYPTVARKQKQAIMGQTIPIMMPASLPGLPGVPIIILRLIFTMWATGPFLICLSPDQK